MEDLKLENESLGIRKHKRHNCDIDSQHVKNIIGVFFFLIIQLLQQV